MTAVEKAKSFDLVLASGSDVATAFGGELAGFELNFDRVKIPAGGGLHWQVPGDDPDRPDSFDELLGVIVDHHPVSALWLDQYTGGANAPDAQSVDGKTQVIAPGVAERCLAAGRPVPSTILASCPYNQWGSVGLIGGTGNGKATKNMHRLYLLREGELLPIVVVVSPGSLKNFGDYLQRSILSKGLRSTDVVTSIKLRQATSGGGITFSQAVFALNERLDQAAIESVRAYAEQLRQHTRDVAVADDEYIDAQPAAVTPVHSDDDIPF